MVILETVLFIRTPLLVRYTIVLHYSIKSCDAKYRGEMAEYRFPVINNAIAAAIVASVIIGGVFYFTGNLTTGTSGSQNITTIPANSSTNSVTTVFLNYTVASTEGASTSTIQSERIEFFSSLSQKVLHQHSPFSFS